MREIFNPVLVAFGLECLIYRLFISPYTDEFALRGGMLVSVWTKRHARYTRDTDFLSFNAQKEYAILEKTKETFAIDAADGLIFNTAKLSVATIRKDQIHGGMRLKTTASLGKAVIPIQIDVGFSDAATVPEYTISVSA